MNTRYILVNVHKANKTTWLTTYDYWPKFERIELFLYKDLRLQSKSMVIAAFLKLHLAYLLFTVNLKIKNFMGHQLRLENKLTASLQRGKIPPNDMTLNNLMVRFQ